MKNLLKKLAIYFTIIFTIIGLNCAILGIANLNVANASTITESINKLLPQEINPDLINLDTEEDFYSIAEAGRYKQLTNKSLPEIIAYIIRTMLYLVSTLTVIALIVVGVMYLTGSLSEDNVSKAKKIFGYVAIGIIIISASYGIVAGILEINFF